MTQLAQSKPITSDGRVWSGIAYKIRSSHNTVLDDWGGTKTGPNSASLQPDDNSNNQNRAWQLIHYKHPFYKIKGAHGTVLDDWAGIKIGQDSASLQPDDNKQDQNRIFELVPMKAPFYKIRGSHGTVLDDWGGKVGLNSAAFQKEYNDGYDHHRIWQFVPLVKLKLSLTDLVYPEDIFTTLQKSKTVDFMDKHQIIVKQGQLEVGRSFKKSITQSFTWGFEQKIGISIGFQAQFNAPFVGGVKTNVSTSLQVGSNQSWSSQQQKQFSSDIKATISTPGVYQMIGQVDVIKNAQIPFKATATITGKTKLRWRKNGSISDEGESMKGEDILSQIKKEKSLNNLPVKKINPNSVELIFSGKLTGSFGMKTRSYLQKKC